MININQYFQNLFLGIFLVSLGLFSIAVPASAFDPLEQACLENPQAVACVENNRPQDAPGENPITETVNNVVSILSIAVGVISVIIIAIAGITMAMSQGDSGKIKSSRDAIIYASVGLVVVAISRLIIIFIINRTS